MWRRLHIQKLWAVGHDAVISTPLLVFKKPVSSGLNGLKNGILRRLNAIKGIQSRWDKDVLSLTSIAGVAIGYFKHGVEDSIGIISVP
jgi:hypothetical protein